MKRLGLGILMCAVVVFGAAACDDNPTEPTNQPVIFTAQLSALNEVPALAPTNAEIGARGSVTITFNLTRDAGGAITGGTVSFDAPLNSFPAGATVRAAHIHNGAAGVAAGVFIDTGLTAANPIVLTNGTGSINLQNVSNGTITPTTLQAVIDNPAGHYFNVHTVVNGGGAVRGQLTRTQ
ncbi:MAG: CHRD domain-containing protein [Vicinamibacterales bacterium]